METMSSRNPAAAPMAHRIFPLGWIPWLLGCWVEELSARFSRRGTWRDRAAMEVARRKALFGAGAAALGSLPGRKADARQDWMRVSTPEPVRFPRRRLVEAFAVLLMRAGYESVDELDFVPMDEFQKEFWLQRRSEQEAYLNQYAPLRMEVGQLGDPLYFDYICYSQWQTIDRQIRKGRAVFQEKEGVEGEVKTVLRDARWRDNASLPLALHQKVGDKILRGIQEGFRDATFDGPAVLEGDAARPEDVMVGVKKILKVFVDNGFCLQSRVEDVVLSTAGDENQFKVRTEGAANAWAIQALQSHNAKVMNHYDALTIDAYMRQCGKKADYTVSPGSGTLHEAWRFV